MVEGGQGKDNDRPRSLNKSLCFEEKKCTFDKHFYQKCNFFVSKKFEFWEIKMY